MCFSAIWIPENADLIWEMRYPISLVLIYIIWREIKLTIEQGQHDRQKC
jgi:hypothetical protein